MGTAWQESMTEELIAEMRRSIWSIMERADPECRLGQKVWELMVDECVEVVLSRFLEEP